MVPETSSISFTQAVWVCNLRMCSPMVVVTVFFQCTKMFATMKELSIFSPLGTIHTVVKEGLLKII